ncbi:MULTISPECIES: hypothetical protein [Bradyrhizobium]|uniref:hypothetical protein n=1 Tax=Bradyrhizobium pachyrhizi TaxID=280333 RepID=UPI0003FE2515
MHLRRLANLWILLLIAAGLLLAPVAPAFARTMPDASAAAMQAMPDDHAMSGQAVSGQAMADDMPCCPEQGKSKGCDDCPFLALCMLSVSLPVPAGAMSLIERDPLRNRIAAHDDRLLDGLGAKPPDHPPRTNV